jgi:hypothetical protein
MNGLPEERIPCVGAQLSLIDVECDPRASALVGSGAKLKLVSSAAYWLALGVGSNRTLPLPVEIALNENK